MSKRTADSTRPKREAWTPERFMRLSEEVFGNKYTYELPEKILSSTKIKAYCPEHNQYFWPNPNDHFRKKTGCPQCGDEKHPGNGLKERGPCASLEKLVSELRGVHGDKYDYSQVTLPSGIHGKITVICQKEGHGIFTPSVSNHLYAKTTCPVCSREARTIHPKVETPEELRRHRWTPERFYDEAARVHGDKFEYVLPEEVRADSKIRARCKAHDYWFTPTVGDHIYKESGCLMCKQEAISVAVRARGVCADMETFVKAATEVHGDAYDYSKVVLGYVDEPVEVVCKVEGHGSFFPTPSNHIHSRTTCPVCARLAKDLKIRKTQEDFLKDCAAVHGDRYDYSKVEYFRALDKVEIVCKEHGSFWQVANDHLLGRGCAACAGSISKPELDLKGLLEEFGVQVVHGHTLSCGLEVDLYCPEHNLGFEYDGLLWHSEEHRSRTYHRDKDAKALEEGVKIVHIYEDDWVYNRDKLVPWVLDKVGVHWDRNYARDCVVESIAWADAKQFLESNHMQGASTPGSVNLGLFTKKGHLLVGVMCFVYTDQSKDQMVLSRFCTDGLVLGGFSKLLKHFKVSKPEGVTKLLSFSDNGWSEGSIYSSNGFVVEAELPPDYYWVKGQKRYVKERFRRQFLPEVLEVFDPEKSEAENCRANGYRKLYDSGRKRWVLYL